MLENQVEKSGMKKPLVFQYFNLNSKSFKENFGLGSKNILIIRVTEYPLLVKQFLLNLQPNNS